MLGDTQSVWNHLRNDIDYKTYSDSKLAGLYLDNVDEFPVHMLVKVLDVLLDPLFKLEDITFKGVHDIFHYISTYRREKLSPSNMRSQLISPSTEREVSRPSVFPTDIMGLVIDKMVENRKPLGVASRGQRWRPAYVDDVSDFHSMSLVHPSWTPIVRRGLRRRAIVPIHQINNFLLSPLCGPWVTELVIYWTVNRGPIGVTDSDIDLLSALLKLTPNVHSLAFNTSLVRLTHDFAWNKGPIPSLRVDTCLKLVSNLLPSLETLRLIHFVPRRDYTSYDYDDEYGGRIGKVRVSESLEACREMGTLIEMLPRMQSLKSLSLSNWAQTHDNAEVDLNVHPYPNLMTLDLYESKSYELQLGRQGLHWLVTPRHEFNLRSLSITLQQLRRVQYPLPSLQELRLYTKCNSAVDFSKIFEGCDQLVDLELFVDSNLDLKRAVFPKNMENITFHMSYVDLRQVLSQPIPAYSEPSWRSSSDLIPIMKENLPQLTRLRSLGLIVVRSVSRTWMAGRNATIRGVPVTDIPRELLDLCEEHNVRLICRNVSKDELEDEDESEDEDGYDHYQ